ncbi:hypothetical protein L6304_04040 [bacterium]|nr:hypothetical protein [bacterium]
MRRLIYIPIIHTEADMGSMAEGLKKEFTRKHGRTKWKEHVRAVDDMWNGIRRKIEGLKLDYKKVRVYQDGLPLSGREMDIARDVAAKGSKNYSIVLDLINQGASLEGTEDINLLLEEYKYVKEVTGITNPIQKEEAIKKHQGMADALLVKRGRFIAQRIDKTLREGETGILFMGIKHEVDKYLPKDIKVSDLIYRLPFKKIFKLRGM